MKGCFLIVISYVRGLEQEVQELKRKRSCDSPPYDTAPAAAAQKESRSPVPNDDRSKVSEAGVHNKDDLQLALDETSIQPHYIGEAACTTFGTRLHQYLTGDHTPLDSRRLHHYQHQKLHRSTVPDHPFPPRNRAQLLVRAVLRFMYTLLDVCALHHPY
jgi:proline utilization trans-activator